MSRASRGKAGEQKVADVLKGIEAPHFLFNDVTFVNATSGMTHQLDHILIHPHGVFVIETKNYYGVLSYDEAAKELSRTVRGRKERLPDPLRQNKSHAITLRKALKSICHPIPVVVFAQDNAPYLPDENVINLSDLPLFVESYPYEKLLSLKDMALIKSRIEAVSVDVSNKEHVENIKIMKKVRKESQAEMAYAIECGLCPRCDHKIVIKGFDYSCPHCGFRFHL